MVNPKSSPYIPTIFQGSNSDSEVPILGPGAEGKDKDLRLFTHLINLLYDNPCWTVLSECVHLAVNWEINLCRRQFPLLVEDEPGVGIAKSFERQRGEKLFRERLRVKEKNEESFIAIAPIHNVLPENA